VADRITGASNRVEPHAEQSSSVVAFPLRLAEDLEAELGRLK
jgi:hypothetical protein